MSSPSSSPQSSAPPHVSHRPSEAVRNINTDLEHLKATLEDDPDDDLLSQSPPRPPPPGPAEPDIPDPPPRDQQPDPPTVPANAPNPRRPHQSPQRPPDMNNSQDALLPETHDEDLTEFHRHWSTVFSSNLSWDEFAEQCEVFAAATKTLAISLNQPRNPPPTAAHNNQPRRPPNGRPVQQYNPNEEKRIQGLYRNSKKRAARRILANNSTTFSGSRQSAQDYFTEVFSTRQCDTDTLLNHLQQSVPPSEDNNSHLLAEMSEEEVMAKLCTASNTAPGPDRVEYHHLKRIDPNAKLLPLIFNRCLCECDMPKAWKDALNILIYKKGSSDDASNFRPIALMSCIYKLFMGVIGKCISSWAIRNNILSDEQKSVRPAEGCYEPPNQCCESSLV